MRKFALILAVLMVLAAAAACAAPAAPQADPTAVPTAEPTVEPTATPVPAEFASVPEYEGLAAPSYSDVAVHDPSIIETEDGTMYIYGSHMTAARTTDLMNWEMFSHNANVGCTLVDNVQKEMEEALTWAKTNTFWAPDVQQLADGRYYMYYCTCEGSSPLSALGLAVSDSPEGPFENLGIFLKSGTPGYDATYYPNAIDPHVFFDKEGRLWMLYGSYSGGIFILELNPETGLPLENQPNNGYGTKLLGKNHSRIEGGYIMYSPETDYYYLFLSFGGLEAADGYNIRVCRSRTPDGPYEDPMGQDMFYCGGRSGTVFFDADIEGYGAKLMGGYQFMAFDSDLSDGKAYRSPGHNSVYRNENGEYFVIFHTRFAKSDAFSVRVHRLFMNEDGWFTASPVRYSGEEVKAVAENARAGEYQIVNHEHDINGTEHQSVCVGLMADGTLSGEMEGTWACEDGQTFTITVGDVVYKGQMNMGYDETQKAWTTVFTAMSSEGVSLWGIRNQ